MGTVTGILGGTFDPVHIGHLAIARSFLESGEIDELWIMPAPDPPHKQNQKITPFTVRIDWLQRAFRGFKNVLISDYEGHLPGPSYTVRTIESLKRDYPDRAFKLCMGTDSLEHIREWHEYKKLLRLCPMLVASRPGYETSGLPPSILENCTFVTHEEVAISSSELKNKLASDPDAWKWIPSNVRDKIRKESLYGD